MPQPCLRKVCSSRIWGLQQRVRYHLTITPTRQAANDPEMTAIVTMVSIAASFYGLPPGSGSPPARVARRAIATGLPGPTPTRNQPAAASGPRAPPFALVGCSARSSASGDRPSRTASATDFSGAGGTPPFVRRSAVTALSEPASDDTNYLQKTNVRLHRWGIGLILARTCFIHARTCMLQPGPRHQPEAGQLMTPRSR